jgi:hypothetical protein
LPSRQSKTNGSRSASLPAASKPRGEQNKRTPLDHPPDSHHQIHLHSAQMDLPATATPQSPAHSPAPKYDVSKIPKGVRIRAICDWESKFRKNSGFHADVFRHVGSSYTAGWEMLRDPAKLDENEAPTLEPEMRGRKRKISPNDVHEVEELLKEHENWARDMNWDQLAAEVFTDRPVIGKTLQRHLGVMDYFRCISCARTWCTSDLAKERLDFARAALEKRPQPSDWNVVAFTDKVHVGPVSLW